MECLLLSKVSMYIACYSILAYVLYVAFIGLLPTSTLKCTSQFCSVMEWNEMASHFTLFNMMVVMHCVHCCDTSALDAWQIHIVIVMAYHVASSHVSRFCELRAVER